MAIVKRKMTLGRRRKKGADASPVVSTTGAEQRKGKAKVAENKVASPAIRTAGVGKRKAKTPGKKGATSPTIPMASGGKSKAKAYGKKKAASPIIPTPTPTTGGGKSNDVEKRVVPQKPTKKKVAPQKQKPTKKRGASQKLPKKNMMDTFLAVGELIIDGDVEVAYAKMKGMDDDGTAIPAITITSAEKSRHAASRFPSIFLDAESRNETDQTDTDFEDRDDRTYGLSDTSASLSTEASFPSTVADQIPSMDTSDSRLFTTKTSIDEYEQSKKSMFDPKVSVDESDSSSSSESDAVSLDAESITDESDGSVIEHANFLTENVTDNADYLTENVDFIAASLDEIDVAVDDTSFDLDVSIDVDSLKGNVKSNGTFTTLHTLETNVDQLRDDKGNVVQRKRMEQNHGENDETDQQQDNGNMYDDEGNTYAEGNTYEEDDDEQGGNAEKGMYDDEGNTYAEGNTYEEDDDEQGGNAEEGYVKGETIIENDSGKNDAIELDYAGRVIENAGSANMNDQNDPCVPLPSSDAYEPESGQEVTLAINGLGSQGNRKKTLKVIRTDIRGKASKKFNKMAVQLASPRKKQSAVATAHASDVATANASDVATAHDDSATAISGGAATAISGGDVTRASISSKSTRCTQSSRRSSSTASKDTAKISAPSVDTRMASNMSRVPGFEPADETEKTLGSGDNSGDTKMATNAGKVNLMDSSSLSSSGKEIHETDVKPEPLSPTPKVKIMSEPLSPTTRAKKWGFFKKQKESQRNPKGRMRLKTRLLSPKRGRSNIMRDAPKEGNGSETERYSSSKRVQISTPVAGNGAAMDAYIASRTMKSFPSKAVATPTDTTTAATPIPILRNATPVQTTAIPQDMLTLNNTSTAEDTYEDGGCGSSLHTNEESAVSADLVSSDSNYDEKRLLRGQPDINRDSFTTVDERSIIASPSSLDDITKAYTMESTAHATFCCVPLPSGAYLADKRNALQKATDGACSVVNYCWKDTFADELTVVNSVALYENDTIATSAEIEERDWRNDRFDKGDKDFNSYEESVAHANRSKDIVANMIMHAAPSWGDQGVISVGTGNVPKKDKKERRERIDRREDTDREEMRQPIGRRENTDQEERRHRIGQGENTDQIERRQQRGQKENAEILSRIVEEENPALNVEAQSTYKTRRKFSFHKRKPSLKRKKKREIVLDEDEDILDEEIFMSDLLNELVLEQENEKEIKETVVRGRAKAGLVAEDNSDDDLPHGFSDLIASAIAEEAVFSLMNEDQQHWEL